MPAPADRPYVFHAFEVSYFSAKVRPALRYKRLWYDEVHADSGLIRERTGLTFMPMLLTPERALNRSRRTPVRTGAWRTSRRRSIGAEDTACRIEAEAGLPVS